MNFSLSAMRLFVCVLFLSFFLGSCKFRERIVYVNLPILDTIHDVRNTFSPILKVDDKLRIQVGGLDQEALAPFQFFYSPSSTGGAMNNNLNNSAPTYLIDINGNINFPILGFVQLAGKTRLDAILYLQNQLDQYVEKPIVLMEIVNFKFSILGQVKAPGVYPVLTDRFTIFEAIAEAGDLQINGQRKNVLVIREKNEKRIEYRLDLTNKNCYNSPAFYICQNDVVYVEPNLSATIQGTNFQTYTQLGTSVISIFLSLFTVITISK